MGRLVGTLATIIIALGLQQLNAQFTTWSTANAACNGACTPSYGAIGLRFCKEGLGGGGCGAVTDYIQLTPCCGNTNVTWGDWTAWSVCTATCGACGRQQRTRICGSPNGCPGNCTGDGTESSASPCDTAFTEVADTYKLCIAPMAACCPPYGRNISYTMKRSVCTRSTTPI